MSSKHGDEDLEFDWFLPCVIKDTDIEMVLDVRLVVSVSFEQEDDGSTSFHINHIEANGETELPVDVFEDEESFHKELTDILAGPR